MPLRVTAFLSRGEIRRSVVADGGALLIGRGEEADFDLPESRLSRRHARITAVEEGWRVEDLASKNGTQLNGRLVPSAHIDAPCWLSLGGVPVYLEPVEGPRRSPAAPPRRSEEAELRPADVLEGALSSVLELTGCARGSVWVAASGALGDEPVIRLGQDEPFEDRALLLAALADEALGKGAGAGVICLPLKAGETKGALYADAPKTSEALAARDAALLAAIADQTALALEGIRLRAAIRAAGS